MEFFMKNLLVLVLKSLFIFFVCISPVNLAADENKLEIASELLDTVGFENLVRTSLPEFKENLTRLLLEAIKDIYPHIEEEKVNILRGFCLEYLNHENFRTELLKVYTELYTEEEMKYIIGVCKTEVFRKFFLNNEKTVITASKALEVELTKALIERSIELMK